MAQADVDLLAYFAWYWRVRPFGSEPWWVVLERHGHLRRHGWRPGDPEVLAIADHEMDDEEYLNWVADMHAATDPGDEDCGCCCCLQSQGRWPPGLPHWELAEQDTDPAADRWRMPDGRYVTPKMIADLRDRIDAARDEPPPAGTWPVANKRHPDYRRKTQR